MRGGRGEGVAAGACAVAGRGAAGRAGSWRAASSLSELELAWSSPPPARPRRRAGDAPPARQIARYRARCLTSVRTPLSSPPTRRSCTMTSGMPITLPPTTWIQGVTTRSPGGRGERGRRRQTQGFGWGRPRQRAWRDGARLPRAHVAGWWAARRTAGAQAPPTPDCLGARRSRVPQGRAPTAAAHRRRTAVCGSPSRPPWTPWAPGSAEPPGGRAARRGAGGIGVPVGSGESERRPPAATWHGAGGRRCANGNIHGALHRHARMPASPLRHGSARGASQAMRCCQQRGREQLRATPPTVRSLPKRGQWCSVRSRQLVRICVAGGGGVTGARPRFESGTRACVRARVRVRAVRAPKRRRSRCSLLAPACALTCWYWDRRDVWTKSPSWKPAEGCASMDSSRRAAAACAPGALHRARLRRAQLLPHSCCRMIKAAADRC